jgi:hypothetical protein
MIHEAIYSLYPNVVVIYGAHDAYDSNKNPVVIDMVAVEQEAQVLQAQARAKEEAIEAIRASAMRKLVENAGLTIEEVRTFLKIDEPTEEEEA